MTRRTLSIALSLPLTVFTILALREGGLAGFYEHHRSWGGLQVFSDLVIMGLLACVWMVLDARRRGLRAWPFVVLTLVAGSYGPLAYLALSPAAPAGSQPELGSAVPERPRWISRLAWVTVGLFGVLTVKALLVHGYWGIWRLQFGSWASLQVLADLTILCLLGSLWMGADARRSGRSSWPYLILTLSAGSFGPLVYLLKRDQAQG